MSRIVSAPLAGMLVLGLAGASRWRDMKHLSAIPKACASGVFLDLLIQDAGAHQTLPVVPPAGKRFWRLFNL